MGSTHKALLLQAKNNGWSQETRVQLLELLGELNAFYMEWHFYLNEQQTSYGSLDLGIWWISSQIWIK
jgi:hypothetical protein